MWMGDSRASSHPPFCPPSVQVLDMGVVQEVVLALERSPVSASDLKDLKVCLRDPRSLC